MKAVAADEPELFEEGQGHDGNGVHYLYEVRHLLNGAQTLLQLRPNLT